MLEKKILIVDDDNFFRQILKDTLQELFKVIEAACGTEALETAAEACPDLIILDVEIPGLSGFEVCRELKEAEQTRHIPVILLSSHNGKAEIIRGLQAGADDYLIKPIFPAEILARIDAHLRSRGYYADLEHKDMQMLLELSDAISVIRNPIKILKIIIGKMTELLQVTRCSIVSVDSRGELVVKASNGLVDGQEIRLQPERYPEICKALETRRAVVINDIKNDPLMEPVRPFIKELDFNSIIVVPIIKKESVIGTLFLRSATNSTAGVTDRVYKLSHLVANISANALVNATLFESMQTAQEFLEEMAIRDGLTRLYTHRHFYDRLEEEFSRATRHHEPLSLIFFDIDDFKQVNDSCGHTCGDEVLRLIGRVIRDVVRESDISARYGGEEFAVLLPHTDPRGALKMARRLAGAISEMKFEKLQGRQITVSTGVATFSGNNLASFDQLVQRADQAMYQAKAEGKNRVAVAADAPLDKNLLAG